MSIPEEAVEAAARRLFEIQNHAAFNGFTEKEYRHLADDCRRDAFSILALAAPIIRAEERKKIAEEIRATNLGAPLVLNSDATARFLSGPELREKICTFITEGSGE
jgi:hypothetical protein